MPKDNFCLVLLFVCAACFVYGALAGAGAPLLEWDWLYLEAAADWSAGTARTWFLDHPPLYPMFLSVPFRLLPPSAETARLLNAVPVLATAGVCYLTAKNLAGRAAGLLAAAMFLLNPVTIQGVRSMDSADSTLLPLFFSLAFYALTVEFRRRALRVWLLVIIFAASFWAKVTSSIGLAAACFTYAAVFRGRADGRLTRDLLLGAVGGALLFFLSWSAVSLPLWGPGSWKIVLSTPFRYLYPGGMSGGQPFLLKWGLELGRIVFWFSPFLLYLAAVKIREIYRAEERAAAQHAAAFLCVFYFAGYIVVGGSNYGFPRYHAAISPFLHIFAGSCLAGLIGAGLPKRWALAVVPFLLAALSTVYLDPELAINLKLKQLVLYGDRAGILPQVVAPLLILTLLPLAAVPFVKKFFREVQAAALVAAAAFFGAGAALAAKQAAVPYSTAYQYGAEGKKDVLARLSVKISGGETVLATPEFAPPLRDKNVSVPGWRVWEKTEGIYSFVREKKPEFIVAGWTTHTISQLKYLLKDGEMRRLLDEGYTFSAIGTYFLWERAGKSAKEAGPSA